MISSPPDISNPRCCCLCRGLTWLPHVLASNPPSNPLQIIKKKDSHQTAQEHVCKSGSVAADWCQRGRSPCVYKRRQGQIIGEHEESSMGVLNIALSAPLRPQMFNKGDLCRLPSGRGGLTLLFKVAPRYFGPTLQLHSFK